jgi:uncharacterized membrane protein YcaP (DUF421 family)
MEKIQPFDWHRILISNETGLDYSLEVMLRTLIMFLFLLIMLKFLSKRGVKQLSIFELAILIALGSATGDPMFYHHVPVLHGFLVLIVVIIIYRAITHMTGKSRRMEIFLEGQPVLLLKNGKIEYENYKKVKLPYDKFFAELRLKNVYHLGQVEKVYLETSGEMSIYLKSEKETNPGLPIFPELLANPIENISKEGTYACIYCGNTERILTTTGQHHCAICKNTRWLKAVN